MEQQQHTFLDSTQLTWIPRCTHHTWSLSCRKGKSLKRLSRSWTFSRIAFLRKGNVRSIRSATTCWLRRVLLNSTWSTRLFLSKDTESSPDASQGCEGDWVFPGLFFLGDFLGLALEFPLLTGVRRNSLNRFIREVTMAPWKIVERNTGEIRDKG